VNNNPVLNKDLLDFKQTDPAGFEKKEGLTTHLWLQDSALLSRQMWQQ
jgi:putative aldouronate transport system substrate-binding protein